MPRSIYIIAGEASGDMLGAQLMQSLQQKEDDIKIRGVGGSHMCEQGLKSLFPVYDIALMGFAEILPHFQKILKRINQTVNDILLNKPDIVVTIDSPGFNLRVAKKLRKRLGNDITLVHYVAPTVWAYKPTRAQKFATLFDHLLVLLPFEPPYFEEVGLPSTFTGHPTVWNGKDYLKENAKNSSVSSQLLLLPGSRKGEVQNHLTLYKATVTMLKKHIPELNCLMVVNQMMADHFRKELDNWPTPLTLYTKNDQKLATFQSCDFALVKSGTVTLEVAMAQVPMIVTYKVNPISAWLIKQMINIPYVSLINIMAKQAILPEYLQEQATANNLSNALYDLHSDSEKQNTQREQAKKALMSLLPDTEQNPSDIAADTILRL